MFDRIFVEKDLRDHPHYLRFLQTLPQTWKEKKIQYVDRYTDIWGKVKKPYLHKRTNLDAFIARKRGDVVKLAPDAYGVQGDQHYYFVHSYNCIYECEYCYLQGYFKTPDLVFFINHDEIILQMQKIMESSQQQQNIWFHAGEFSDSLAMSHFTQELPYYFDFCKKNPRSRLELRTKSVNIKELVKLNPLSNVYVTFSLSPQEVAKSIDRKTPSINARIQAMARLAKQGYQLAIHFDPVVYHRDFQKLYDELFIQLFTMVPIDSIHYYSLGVVRFTKEVYREVQINYPNSSIHHQPMGASFDGKVRYHRPMRTWMLGQLKNLLIRHGVVERKIYFCMENADPSQ